VINIKLKKGLSLIILIILVLSISGCIESSIVGEDFVFIDLDGNERHLSDFYGKVIVLDLMGVNCQPCFYEMFELKKISENYSSENVAIISIDVWVTYGENMELLKEYKQFFNQEYDIDLDWIFGLDDESGTIFYKYSNEGVPTMYILDKNGNIYYSNVGYTDYLSLTKKLDELIK